MWILLRPGPQVNAEMNNFGLPDRIVRDKQIQALGPRGRPVFCPSPPVFFPIPSYASTKYLEEVGVWFRAVGSALGPVLERANPVRLVQVDNETSLFFREAPFDQDYHPEALALWREWLEQRSLPGWDAPLRREPGREGLRRALSWVRFRQWMMLGCLGRMRGQLEEAGLPAAPLSHNMPPSGIWQPLRPGQLAETVDVVATDVYATASRFENARNQVLQLRSVDDEPFASEMGCGTVYFAPGIGPFDNRFAASAALAYGLKGFNLYMGAGRDRWIGGLVPEEGEREGADLLHFYQRLIRLLGTLKLRDLRPLSGAVVVVPDAYYDLSLAAFPLPGASPALLAALGLPLHEMLAPDRWDLGRPVQSEWIARLTECQEALSSSSIPYTMADGTKPAADDTVLLAPTFRFLSSTVVSTILDHVDSGARAVAGPEDPELDESLEPLPSDLTTRWREARSSGDLVVAASLDDPDVTDILRQAARSVADQLPFEISIRDPLTDILPHRGSDEDACVTWLVARGAGPGKRTVLKPRRGWRWTRRLAVREKPLGGEFIQEMGARGEALALELAGREVHLVEWRRGDVE
jgi:beta-galactosidase